MIITLAYLPPFIRTDYTMDGVTLFDMLQFLLLVVVVALIVVVLAVVTLIFNFIFFTLFARKKFIHATLVSSRRMVQHYSKLLKMQPPSFLLSDCLT